MKVADITIHLVFGYYAALGAWFGCYICHVFLKLVMFSTTVLLIHIHSRQRRLDKKYNHVVISTTLKHLYTLNSNILLQHFQ